MTKVNVLLSMAGEATRWNNYLGVDKHFAPILGEPVVERTVRKLLETKPENVELSIIAVVKEVDDPKYDVLRKYGVKVEKANLDPSVGDADKILSSEHLADADAVNIWVWADSFLSDACIGHIWRQALSPNESGWGVVARLRANPWTRAVGGENFAHIIQPEFLKEYIKAVRAVGKLYNEKKIDRSGGWEIYRKLSGVPDDKILIWYGEKFGSLVVQYFGNLTEVYDGSEDFDTPADYDNWVASYKEGSDEHRKFMERGQKPLTITVVQFQHPPVRWIGAEIYNHEVLRELVRRGHSVNVITKETPEQEPYVYEGVRVNFPAEASDIVITNTDARQQAWQVKRQIVTARKTAKFVGIIHNERPENKVHVEFFHWDALIANSDYIAKLYNMNADFKQVLIPRALKPNVPKRRKANKKYHTLQLSLATSKGGVKWLEILEKAYPNKKQLAFVGGWDFQVNSDSLKTLETRPNQKLNHDFWKDVEVFLLPSSLESWSMAAGEAIANGVPVVTFSDLKGVAENLGKAAVYIPRNYSEQQLLLAVEQAKKIPLKVIEEQAERNYIKHMEQLRETLLFIEELGN